MNIHESILQLQKVVRRQHKALNTENTYLYWLKRYIPVIQHLPKTLTSEKKVEHFLNGLAGSRAISTSTQHQAFNAIVFFYKDVLGKPLQNLDAMRVSRPAHLRHAPTIPEVRALL
jgi:hypothetical protein